jgi:RNA polymerase sigma-70 factor (ECF subfamily)
MRIAVNAHVDKRRHNKVGRTETLVDETSETEVSPLARAAGRELSEALESALLELPETARIVFLLRTREDLSFSDISRAIETTEETARWHMYQARRRLLKLLEPWL